MHIQYIAAYIQAFHRRRKTIYRYYFNTVKLNKKNVENNSTNLLKANKCEIL